MIMAKPHFVYFVVLSSVSDYVTPFWNNLCLHTPRKVGVNRTQLKTLPASAQKNRWALKVQVAAVHATMERNGV